MSKESNEGKVINSPSEDSRDVIGGNNRDESDSGVQQVADDIESGASCQIVHQNNNPTRSEVVKNKSQVSVSRLPIESRDCVDHEEVI